jgi:ribosomal protein S18 acetylase RimI-like enzyme
VPPLVRITPLVVAAGAALEASGFARESPTEVMVAPIVASAPAAAVDVASHASAEWLEAQAALQGVPVRLRRSWEGIIDRIARPAGFALARDEFGAVAAGLAVAEPPWAGLFEINVAPEYRRRGLGRVLSTALLSWAHSAGAERAYLQVLADNEPAIALYRKLGFEVAYRYWYLRRK